jgi:hypothetical protein
VNREEEFFVGYLPMPPRLRQRTRIMVGLGAAAIAAVALTLAFAQHGFAHSVFEFGEYRNFEGVILERPYPMLLVRRPGKTSASQPFSAFLLVDQFKHGADARVRGLDGKNVRLQGQLIYRDEGVMLELKPGSVQQEPQAGQGLDATMKSLGQITVAGELVDTKCYLGVMNPGSGKVHRDCAARCVSGGIPLAVVVHENGDGHVYLVAGIRSDGAARGLIHRVGEVVSLTGEGIEVNGQKFILLGSWPRS